MKLSISFILLFIFSPNLFSQAVFAWCPEEQIIYPKNGFLEDKIIDLYIYDARTSTDKTLVNCNGEKIRENLIRLIKETYTSADINMINSSVEPIRNRVTIKIGIATYQVGLGAGIASQRQHSKEISMTHEAKVESWKAEVGYSLEVTDFTKSNKSHFTNKIFKSSTGPKTENYLGAKEILTNTFGQANQELIIFIDDAFLYKNVN